MTGAEIAVVATIVAAAASAAATVYSSNQQARAAEYNAELAEQQAEVARQEAAVREAAKRRETRRRLSAQKAAFAVSGVTPVGSPMELAEQTAIDGELDALTIRYSGESASTRAKNSARLKKFEASATRSTGFVNAGATLIGGGADAYTAYKAQQPAEPVKPNSRPNRRGSSD